MRRKIKNKKEILIILFIIIFFSGAKITSAATFFFDPVAVDAAEGEKFGVEILLDTEGESINAISGSVIFPSGFLNAIKISDGDSFVSIWIKKPEIKENRVEFSGIIPGGINKENVSLFSLIFSGQKEGLGEINFQDVEALKNDGMGTKVGVKTKNININISATATSAVELKEEEDRDPPESFRPEIGQDENMFDGQFFLVFSARDKNSGIYRYEVKEGFFGEFAIAESPYLLKNQKLNKKIYVKAVDNAGNERIVNIKSRYELWLYENWIYLFIIVAMASGLCLSCLKIWKRIKNRQLQ